MTQEAPKQENKNMGCCSYFEQEPLPLPGVTSSPIVATMHGSSHKDKWTKLGLIHDQNERRQRTERVSDMLPSTNATVVLQIHHVVVIVVLQSILTTSLLPLVALCPRLLHALL